MIRLLYLWEVLRSNCLKCNKGYTLCTSIPLAWVWPKSFRPKIPRLWKFSRKPPPQKKPYHLGFQKKNIEMLSVVQCNIPHLLTRFIRKYCKNLHNSSACKLPFVSSKRSFRLIMLTPIQLIDCPSPKSLNRKGIKESKAEVERLDSRDGGEDLLVLIDHYIWDKPGRWQARRTLLMLHREVRGWWWLTGHVSLFSLVSVLHYVQKKHFKKNTTIDAALPQLKRAMRVSEPKKLSIVWTSSGRS